MDQKGAKAPFFMGKSLLHEGGTPVRGGLWLPLFAVLLAVAYVLPNHYLPWMSFHAEAWAFGVLWFVAAAVLLRNAMRGGVIYRAEPMAMVVVLMLAAIVLQFVSGHIVLGGVAWMVFLYVLSLGLMLQLGQVWHGQVAAEPYDMVFAAWILAGVVSLPMQLMQWTDAHWTTVFVLHLENARRPFANLGQPNHLADLFLFALIGVHWFWQRRSLPSPLACILALCMLLGAALTVSRTAWLALLLVAGYATVRPVATDRRMQMATLTGLAFFFVLCVVTVPALQMVLLNTDELPGTLQLSTGSSSARLGIWHVVLKASLQAPWTGVGWGQIIHTNFWFDERMGAERGFFNDAHNLVLDLLLWNGYPLAMLLLAGLTWALWRLYRAAPLSGVWHVQVVSIVVLVHALLEFPLSYSYFLLPWGLLLGAAMPPSGLVRWSIAPAGMLSIWAVVGGMGVVTLRDYAAVEPAFYALRMEAQKLLPPQDPRPPDIRVLTQFREYFRLARIPLDKAYTAAEMEHLEQVAHTTPDAHILYRLALLYALQGQTDRAGFWLRQLCVKSHVLHCQEAQVKWDQARIQYGEQRLMPWPEGLYAH